MHNQQHMPFQKNRLRYYAKTHTVQDTLWPIPGLTSAVLRILVEDCYHMHEQIIPIGLATLLIDYTTLHHKTNIL